MNRFLYEYIYLKLFLCYQIFFKVRGVVDVSQNNAAVRVSAFFVEHNFCHARVAEGYIHIVGQLLFKAEQIKNHVGQKARVQNNGDLFTAAVKAQYCVESPLGSFLYIRVMTAQGLRAQKPAGMNRQALNGVEDGIRTHDLRDHNPTL